MPRPFILRKIKQSVLRKQDEPINTIRGQDASEEIELSSNVSSATSKNFGVGRVMSFFSSLSNSAAKIFAANNNLSETITSNTVSNIPSIQKIFNTVVDNTKDLSFAAQKNISNIKNILSNTLKSIILQPLTSNIRHRDGDVIYALDNNNSNRVNVFTLDGSIIPNRGFDVPSFINNPVGMAVNANYIYIIDSSDNTLYVFNYDGIRQIDREVFSLTSADTYVGISAERLESLYVLSDSTVYEYDYNGNIIVSFDIINDNPLGISIMHLLNTDLISVLQGNADGVEDEVYFYTFGGAIGSSPNIENTNNATSISFVNEQFVIARADNTISFHNFGGNTLTLDRVVSTNLNSLNNIQVILGELYERFSIYNVNKVLSNSTNIISRISSLGLNILNSSIVHPTSVIFSGVRKILSNISRPISSTVSRSIRDVILTSISNTSHSINNQVRKYINNSTNIITSIFSSILNNIIVLSSINIGSTLSQGVSNIISLNAINNSMILNNIKKDIQNILNIFSIVSGMTSQILSSFSSINIFSGRRLSVNIPINNIVRASVDNIFSGVKNISNTVSNTYNRIKGRAKTVSNNVLTNSETALDNFTKIIQSTVSFTSNILQSTLNMILFSSSVSINTILNKYVSFSLQSNISVPSIINTFINYLFVIGSTVNTIPSILRKGVNILISNSSVNATGRVVSDVGQIIFVISNVVIGSILIRNTYVRNIISLSNINSLLFNSIRGFILSSITNILSSPISKIVNRTFTSTINTIGLALLMSSQMIISISDITVNSTIGNNIRLRLVDNNISISSLLDTFRGLFLNIISMVGMAPSVLRKSLNIVRPSSIVNAIGETLFRAANNINVISSIVINTILNKFINYTTANGIISNNFILGKSINSLIGNFIINTTSTLVKLPFITINSLINNISSTMVDIGQTILSMSNVAINGIVVKNILYNLSPSSMVQNISNIIINIPRIFTSSVNIISNKIYNIYINILLSSIGAIVSPIGKFLSTHINNSLNIISNNIIQVIINSLHTVNNISRTFTRRVIQLISNINISNIDRVIKDTMRISAGSVENNTILIQSIFNRIFSVVNQSNILRRGRIFISSITNSSGIRRSINKSILSGINSIGSLMDMVSEVMESISNVFVNSITFKYIRKNNNQNIVNTGINNIFAAQKNNINNIINPISTLLNNIITSISSNINISSIQSAMRRFIQFIESIISIFEDVADSFNIYTLNDRPNQVNVIDMAGNLINSDIFNFDNSINSIEGISITEDRIYIISNADDMIYVFNNNGERQEDEEVWDLVSATYRGISSDINNRLLILSTNRLYVYDYDGNRYNDEEININPLLISATGVMVWRNRIYILDKESSSSGTDRVRVYDINGDRLSEHDNILPNYVRNANGISHTDDNILIGQGINVYIFDENWVEDVNNRISVPVNNSRIRGLSTRPVRTMRGISLVTNKIFNIILSPISGIINRGISKIIQLLINSNGIIRNNLISKILQKIIHITHHLSISGLNVNLSSDFAIISNAIRESHRSVHTISDVVGEITRETHRVSHRISDLVSTSFRETHRISHIINDVVGEITRETHRISLAISDNVREEVRIVNDVVKRIYSNTNNISILFISIVLRVFIESIVNVIGSSSIFIKTIPALITLYMEKAARMKIKIISQGDRNRYG